MVRFLDPEGNDIIPRKDKVWTTEALASRMIQALKKSGQVVPKYLKTLSAVPNRGKAAFSMYCFWTGEMRLGAIDGVLTTEAGWFDGREVTLVEFDRDQLSFASLLNKATSFDCARNAYTTDPDDLKIVKASRLTGGTLTDRYRKASKKDQKRQIMGTKLATLTLHPVQATKVNAIARSNYKEALSWLSPRQRLAIGE